MNSNHYTNNILGIAGGSGSGKTTVAINLYKKYPDKIAVMHLDDYYQPIEKVARVGDNLPDWDHPSSLMFDALARDLEALKRGEAVRIMTKSKLYNPDYDPRLRNKIPYTVEPKKIIIVEGYLVFHDERIRRLLDKKVYLDIPIEISLTRRKQPSSSQWYLSTIVIPVHKEFVEPTRQYADAVIDITHKKEPEVEALVEQMIMPWITGETVSQ